MDEEVLDSRRLRLRRLRWRLRGAWLWPAFAALTLADTVLLHLLPVAGDGRTPLGAAFLLAGCSNIVVVAAFGGLLGWRLRRRRPDLPKVVADDYAGTALLALVTLAFLGFGLTHRPRLAEEREDFRAQSMAVRRYVAASAPAEFRRRVDEADTVTVDEDLYRTCVPGPDPARFLCVFVDTSGHPATVRLDDNRESNASFARAGSFER